MRSCNSGDQHFEQLRNSRIPSTSGLYAILSHENLEGPTWPLNHDRQAAGFPDSALIHTGRRAQTTRELSMQPTRHCITNHQVVS
jgi:hypothetical protein